jgi:hypothetical protein
MNEVRAIMNRHGFLYGVSVERRGVVTEFGLRSALEHAAIVEEYFLADPPGIFEWLEGQILPQLVSQGRVAASIHQPSSNLVVGLFSHRVDDSAHRFQFALAVDRELAQALKVSS